MGRSERRRWAGVYLRGLLLDGERKSVEPLAARAGGDVQALQQFIGQSPWASDTIQEAFNKHMCASVADETYWILDETSFPKQGMHSVGVARQYCGALGKIANCQVAVSLHYSGEKLSWPLGWRLYLPERWIRDEELRRKAGVPPALEYRSKPQLALELIQSALKQQLPRGIVTGDQLYGEGFAFRLQIQSLNLSYALAVDARTGVWPGEVAQIAYKGRGRPARFLPRDQICSLKEVALSLPVQSWKEICWREGTKGPQRSRFAHTAVCAASRGKGNGKLQRATEELLIEWPSDSPEPTKYWLCWSNEDLELTEWVRHAKARWRIEQDYRELKEELGLDHFEGRGWLGWHHHITMVTLAFGFLRLEQLRFKKNSVSHPATHP
jgi:SRSO17 transposase